MLRRYIDLLNFLVAWTRKSRRIDPGAEVVKVNLGSSIRVVDGWINVDGTPHVLFAGMPTPLLRFLYRTSDAKNWCGEEDHYIRQLKNHNFVHHRLEYGLPFPDGSADYLYSSHVLEHFDADIAEKILSESFRVLKTGGRVRICVPDLQYAFSLYAQGAKAQALNYFFVGSKAGSFHQHRYMYDFDLLSAALKKAGFKSVERCSYQQGSVPDIELLDNRPQETLYVEAVK